MPRSHHLVLLRAVAGREAEFDDWYDNRHLADVAKVDGVVSARRFNIDWQKANKIDVPAWRSLAIYEIDADDPHVVLAAISALADTEAMPLSDAMDRNGMLRFLATATATATATAEI